MQKFALFNPNSQINYSIKRKLKSNHRTNIHPITNHPIPQPKILTLGLFPFITMLTWIIHELRLVNIDILDE